MLVASEDLPPNLIGIDRFGTRSLEVPQLQQRWISILAPAGLPFTHQTKSQRKGYIISIIGTTEVHIISNLDANVKIGTISKDKLKVHQSSVALVANTSNWRKVAKDLIGDENVSYDEKSKKDTLRKFPIINIFSTDPEALKRVQTTAAEVE